MESVITQNNNIKNIRTKCDNIILIKKVLWLILIPSIFLELILFPNWANFTCCITTLVATYLFCNKIFNLPYMMKAPLAFIVILQVFLFMYFPITLTLLDGNQVSHDMYNPVKTFVLQFLYFALTVFSFRLAYRYSLNHRGLSVTLNKIGFFHGLTQLQLWILGILGWIPKFYMMAHQFQFKDDTHYMSGFGTLNMFAIFIYAPIVILFLPLLGGEKCSSFQKKLVYAYMAITMLLLVASNSRGQMLSVMVVYVFVYLLQSIYSHHTKKILSIKKIIVIIIIAFIGMGPVSDMAFAMYLARSSRSHMSASELLELTMDIYMDKESLTLIPQHFDLTLFISS